ncbi:polysaccharide export protein [Neisseria sp. S1]|uniref:polysaccharide export protein n=1 Tax=Neisseria sp. S1 TaxID=3318354 RepID=UPI003A8BFBA6
MKLKRLTIIGFSLLALTTGGCTVIPGSSLPTKNKTWVYNENHTRGEDTLDSRVNVYPITLNLIQSMRQPPRTAQHNQALNQQKSAYRYRVGPGDVLNIMVWHHPDLNSPVPSSMNPQSKQVSSGAWVDETGHLSYPLAGKLYVQGKTLPEIQNMLEGRLKRYIKTPQVSVNVTEFRSQRISIAGAVGQPGQLPITNIPVTLLDAIDQAGGLAANADTQNVKLTHNGVDRTISLQEILQYGDLSQNQLLSHGDIVYVPTTENSKVYVMGEVNQQTSLPIGSHGLSLTQALGEAKGMNQALADATGVFVVRNAPHDVEKPIHIYQLNLKDATAYALGNEFKLRANDVVFVTAAPLSRWNRVMSLLTNSVSNLYNLDSTFK